MNISRLNTHSVKIISFPIVRYQICSFLYILYTGKSTAEIIEKYDETAENKLPDEQETDDGANDSVTGSEAEDNAIEEAAGTGSSAEEERNSQSSSQSSSQTSQEWEQVQG